jgi:hypothetical protein
MDPEDKQRESLRATLARMALHNPKVSTTEAFEAQRILRSIQNTKPVDLRFSTEFYNTELDTRVKLNRLRANQPTDISFTTDGGYSRPDVPNTRVRRLGVQAAINQGVDQIPSARDGTGFNASYTAEPISDSKDRIKQQETGSKDNQRAKLYRRISKGAMNAVPDKHGFLKIRGERISDDTWQPRGEKGRFQKYVKWDLSEPVQRLDKIARQTIRPLSILAKLAMRSHPYTLAADLIREDVMNTPLGVADVYDENGNLTALARQGLAVRSTEKYGPPAPKTLLQPPSSLVIKPPPPKDTAVLAKKGGKTGSLINGLFIEHPWSTKQRLSYKARGGK